MLSLEYQKSISETLDILNNMQVEYINQIPKKFMIFLTKNKSHIYNKHIHPEINLNSQINEKYTRAILGIIAYNYWYNSDEKEKFLQKLSENEAKMQDELRQEYDVNNILKNKKKNISNKEVSMVLIENKKWYQKIFDRIKRIFKQK